MSKAQSEYDPRAANLKFTKAELRIAVEAWKEAKKEYEGTSRINGVSHIVGGQFG